MNGTPWSPEDWARALSMRNVGATYLQIAEELRTNVGRVATKFNTIRAAHKRKLNPERQRLPAAGAQPASDVRAERDYATRGTQSLTASLLGDPLPGRSALDKMRMNQDTKLVSDSGGAE